MIVAAYTSSPKHLMRRPRVDMRRNTSDASREIILANGLIGIATFDLSPAREVSCYIAGPFAWQQNTVDISIQSAQELKKGNHFQQIEGESPRIEGRQLEELGMAEGRAQAPLSAYQPSNRLPGSLFSLQ